MGGPEEIKESVRDTRLGASVISAIRDVGYAGRSLRKAPGFTLLAVVTLALQEAALPVVVGLAGGIAASTLVVRVVRNLLYGMRGVDASVSVATALLCLVAAVFAALAPARRASAVDPMEALRLE